MQWKMTILAVALMGCAIDTSGSLDSVGFGDTISGDDLRAYWDVQGAWLLMGFEFSERCEERLFSVHVWRSSYADLLEVFPEWEGKKDTLKGLYLPYEDVDYVWVRTDTVGTYPLRQVLYHELIHYMQGCTGFDGPEHPEELFGMNGKKSNVLSCALEPSEESCFIGGG